MNFAVSDVCVIYQTPQWMSIGGLGFESIYYFSRAFKNAVGISPLEYKEKN